MVPPHISEMRSRNLFWSRRLWRLRSAIVAVMQAAQSRSRHDRALVHRPNSAHRCSLIQSKVSSVFMVVADIVGKKPLQVALVDGNDVIQQIAATTLDPSFCGAVLPGTLERSAHRTHGHRTHCHRHLQSVFGVTDQRSEIGKPSDTRTPPATAGPSRGCWDAG